METALSKSDGKQIKWSRNDAKQAKIMRKIFQYLFGRIDDLSIPLKVKARKSLGQ